MANDSYDFALGYKAYTYIKRRNENLIHNNRYFTDVDFLTTVENIFNERECYLDPSITLKRARRIHYNQIKKENKGSKFEGFNEKESFVNLANNWPISGRMNPTGICVLYAASDIRTAITELHPYYSELFSVADIQLKDPLKIVDLSTFDKNAFKDEQFYLVEQIQSLLSNGSSDEEYVFPQFISSFCKHLGYDGIAYRSKYAREADYKTKSGINFTIFNYDKCKAVSSKIYQANRISIQINDYSL